MQISTGLTSVSGSQNYFIEEDSIIHKTFGCIPIVGSLLTFFNEHSLAKKIRSTTNIPNLIRLIEVKNHYKISGIVNGLIGIAITATLMAMGILQGTASVYGGCGLMIVGIYNYGYKLYHNIQLVKELRTTGIRPLMQVR